MDDEDDQLAIEATESTSPIAWLLVPFVATWDGIRWFFGSAIPNFVRRVRDALTPLVLRIRQALATFREKISELLYPVLRPFAWAYDKLSNGYHRIADGLRPAVDRAYAAPIAFGKWWQGLRARIVARLRAAQHWWTNLAIWRQGKAALAWVVDTARATTQRIVAPVRRQIQAIRDRRS